MTATLETLSTRNTVGKVSAMIRPAPTATSMSPVLARSNRSRSWSSRTNARTTRMPVICSRSTRLIPSSRVCIIRNRGRIRTTATASTAPRSGTTTRSSADSCTSSRSAMTTPPTIITGAAIMIVRPR
jgi:hypothetical protein